jgi:ubiquinone/menaquinone biosynthesis C-methylase UbiE
LRYINSQYADLDQTLRRFYIDEFFIRHVSSIPDNSLVLDLGGNKINKRGQFNINKLKFSVVYANLSVEKRPDVLADGVNLPFRENVFNAIICSELLEHVYSPESVLREVLRVLKPQGVLLITVPFLVQHHADPYDFGRYTNHYWEQILHDIGFSHIVVEKQGYFWSVLLDMLRGYVLQLQDEQSKYMSRFLSYFLKKAVILGRKTVISKETFPRSQEKVFFENYTTGFGISAMKE